MTGGATLGSLPAALGRQETGELRLDADPLPQRHGRAEEPVLRRSLHLRQDREAWRSPRFPPSRLMQHLPGCSEAARPPTREVRCHTSLNFSRHRWLNSSVNRPLHPDRTGMVLFMAVRRFTRAGVSTLRHGHLGTGVFYLRSALFLHHLEDYERMAPKNNCSRVRLVCRWRSSFC